MLGSFQDAEDAVQDTLLSAWQAMGSFESRSSIRTWLYSIATNRCLNARRSASTRRPKEWNVANVIPPEPSRLGDIVWLQPFPDALEGGESSPESWIEQSESMSLAFVTALQALPRRQVAVLILRDVLGFHATEVALMLGTTVDAVNGALKRGRAGLQHRNRADDPPPPARSSAEMSIVHRFVSAYQSADITAVVSLLTDDVFISMPPMPFEYEGKAAAAQFLAAIFGAGRMFDLVPTRANGQPAFGTYLKAPDGERHGVGLLVITLAGNRISAMTRFEGTVLPWFGLPRSMAPAAIAARPEGDE